MGADANRSRARRWRVLMNLRNSVDAAILILIGLFLAICARSVSQGSPPAPPVTGTAGVVTHLRPAAFSEEDNQPVVSLTKWTCVEWQSLVRTEPSGRVRLALVDDSVMNIGSSARVRVVPHAQQTGMSSLVLAGGKVRAIIRRKSGPRSFELRTNSAAVGVVGTDFYVEARDGWTKVISLDGTVLVRNAESAVAGVMRLEAGEKTAVDRGQPPAPKSRATMLEMQKAMADTDATGALNERGATGSWCPERRGPQPVCLPRLELRWAGEWLTGELVVGQVNATRRFGLRNVRFVPGEVASSYYGEIDCGGGAWQPWRALYSPREAQRGAETVTIEAGCGDAVPMLVRNWLSSTSAR